MQQGFAKKSLAKLAKPGFRQATAVLNCLIRVNRAHSGVARSSHCSY